MTLRVKEKLNNPAATGILSVVWLLLLFAFRRLRRASGIGAIITAVGVTESDAGLLWNFQTGVILVVTLVVIVSLYLLSRPQIRWDRLFALLVLTFGLVYLFVITPISVPDEPSHYTAAYEVAGYFTSQPGDTADFDYTGFQFHANVASGIVRVVRELFGAAVHGEAYEPATLSGQWTLSYAGEYLPQAIGILLARLLDANMVTTFLMGRLTNLLFFVFCVYAAVKRTPAFKPLFGMIAILPMTLQQAASLSYDCFVNGLALVLIASLMKAVAEEGRLKLSDQLWILIPAMLLTPAKGVYALLAMLALFIPKERFGSGRKKALAFAVMAAACLAFFAAVSLPSLLRILNSKNAGTGLAGEKEYYSLAWVLAHPGETLAIFLRTIDAYLVAWLEQAVGSGLSTLNLAVPKWIVVAYIVIMSLLGAERQDRLRITAGMRVSFLLIPPLTLLVFMAVMFFTWIGVGDSVIDGVQGRYLTPVLVLLFAGLNGKYLDLSPKADRSLLFLSVLLEARTLLYAAQYTVTHI